ncbi:MAG: WD40 repeat domain-containing protein, partial [Hyphomonadaceae bacterium]
SPDGSRIVTASQDWTARVWDAASGGEISVLRGHENDVRSAAFSPDGSRIVTGGDGTARVWDAASGGELALLRGHGARVRSAVFSPDGSRIVTAGGVTARVWDAASGGEIAVLHGHENVVASAAFSADGSRIITASWDSTSRVWDAASGGEIAALRGHDDSVESAAFSADGSRIVTVSGATARVWDVSRLEGLVGPVAEILAAALTNGRGVRTEAERQDMLMSMIADEDDDLCAALIRRLEAREPGAAARVAARAAILARPLHPNCYLAPSARPGWTKPTAVSDA